jgi:hypothetical protein
MTTRDSIREAVAAITPREVHDRISTIAADTPTWPDQCCQCPLYEFFVEEFPDERVDAVYFKEVAIADNDSGERVFYRLPGWMFVYQDALIDYPICTTMGRAVEILEDFVEGNR